MGSLPADVRLGFCSVAEPIGAESAHLGDFFRRFAGDVSNGATMLFLGSGGGAELLHARNVFPDVRLVAIDREVTQDSILTEVAANAIFIQVDLSGKHVDELLGQIGAVPTVVVARHPNMGRQVMKTVGGCHFWQNGEASCSRQEEDY